MDGQNTGSFGQGLGDTSALREALTRRGINPGVLNQQSEAAAGPTPPGPPSEMTTANAAMPQAMGAPQPAQPQPDSDVTLAVKALSGLIKSDQDLKKGAMQLRGMGRA